MSYPASSIQCLPSWFIGRRRSSQTAGIDLRPSRPGVTLVEMMVVIAVTLILMLALTQIFSWLGDSVHSGRSVIEQNAQLRATAVKIQQDLDGLTVPTLPWTSSAAGLGYLEIIEGVQRDRDTAVSTATDTTIGDRDDFIAFTARSLGAPFVGRIYGTLSRNASGQLTIINPGTSSVIESTLAEIIYWTAEQPVGNVNLYRRVLLIRPDIDVANEAVDNSFFDANDISARLSGGVRVANSLADLTMRENRFAHAISGFPFPVLATTLAAAPLALNRRGEDILLAGIRAFDIRVFDPDAPIRSDGTVALVPTDPGWVAATTVIGQGAYVDMNYMDDTGVSLFSGPPALKSLLSTGLPTYDTWSFSYEANGVNEDSDTAFDEGTDGIDNDGFNGVDDAGERETSPPYPGALRGLQIKLRVYDATSRKVHQETVTANFIPE
jgi:prepilin-type N-terminal cleavage/methylation domain-containing protein